MGGIMSIFGGGERPAPVMPAPPPPAIDDGSVAAAAAAERKRQQAAAGRASTDLTGGTGDLTTATTASKSLLG